MAEYARQSSSIVQPAEPGPGECGVGHDQRGEQRATARHLDERRDQRCGRDAVGREHTIGVGADDLDDAVAPSAGRSARQDGQVVGNSAHDRQPQQHRRREAGEHDARALMGDREGPRSVPLDLGHRREARGGRVDAPAYRDEFAVMTSGEE
jgi:hypothetical protein